MLEMRNREISSKTFLFLPSIADHKEFVNHFLYKVSLSPVDCLHEDFKKYSPLNKGFNPADLDIQGNEKEDAAKTMYAFLKKMCQICDGNLIRNVDYLVQKSNNLNYSDLKWIDEHQKRFGYSRLQLDYTNL